MGWGGESRMFGVLSPAQVSLRNAWMDWQKTAPHLASSSSSVKATTISWNKVMARARLVVWMALLWTWRRVSSVAVSS